MIPNNGLLRYPGVFSIEQVFPTTPEVLEREYYAKNYTFIKSTLVTDNGSNIFGKKELLFAEGSGHKAQRRLLLPASAHAHIRGLVPGFGLREQKWLRKWRGGARFLGSASAGEEGREVEVGKWFSSGTRDIIGSFGFGYEFRTLASASISGSSNAEENPSPELVDAYR